MKVKLLVTLLVNIFVIAAPSKANVKNKTISDVQNCQAASGFKIKGYIKGLSDGVITLNYRPSNHNGQEKWVVLNADVKDGHFEFQGHLKSPVYCTIRNSDYLISSSFWLDNNEITFEGDIEKYEFEVAGSEVNNEDKYFHKYYDEYYDEEIKASRALNDAKDRKEAPWVIDRYEKQLSYWRNRKFDFGEKFVRENPNSEISLNYLFNCTGTGNEAYAARVFDLLSQEIKDSYGGRKIWRRIEGINHSKIGELLTDREFEDPSGGLVRFSDYRGKYLLLAIGNGKNGNYQKSVKVRKEIPGHNIAFVDVLFSLKSKDEIFSLSKELGISWPIYSDYSHGETELTTTYNVGVYPTFFLIDPNGVILKRDIGIDDLPKVISTLTK